MVAFLDPLRDINTLAVLARMVLAVIFGGLIGLEREFKRRPAGFRTHILICLGAAITTLTSQYLALTMQYYTDVARLGAQVIAGVGFIGAGTIIVTRRRRVKGLTTAAGLWTAAIVGLSVGAGYYEAAAYTTLLILLAELVFSRLEYRILKNIRDVCLCVEYRDNDTLEAVIHLLRQTDVSVTDLEITHTSEAEKSNRCAILTLQTGKKIDPARINGEIAALPGIFAVEEL